MEKERKATMKQKYVNLCEKLELENALLRHKYKLEAVVKSKTESVIIDKISVSSNEQYL